MLLPLPCLHNTDDGVDSHMFNGGLLDILEEEGYTIVGYTLEDIFFFVFPQLRSNCARRTP